MSYRTPQNKVVLSNETSQSISFYYIAATDGDPSNLHVVGSPSGQQRTDTKLSVTYDGLPAEVLNGSSVRIVLQNGSETIPGSEVIVNITIIGQL